MSQGPSEGNELKQPPTHSTHKCPLFPSYNLTRWCDQCRQDISYGHYSGRCSNCNYDECLKCSSKNRIKDKEENSVCQLGVHIHPLMTHSAHERILLGLYGSEIYRCNLCRKSVEGGGVSFSCTMCNFDACPECSAYIMSTDQIAKTDPKADKYIKNVKSIKSRKDSMTEENCIRQEYKADFDLSNNSDIYDWNVMKLHQHIKIQSINRNIVKSIRFKDKFEPYRNKASEELSNELQNVEGGIESQKSLQEIISWAHNRSCTRLYTISRSTNNDKQSLFLSVRNFSGDKSKPLSSSRITRLSHLRQKPDAIFQLDTDQSQSQDKEDLLIQQKEEGGDPERRNAKAGDQLLINALSLITYLTSHTIQIQVSDFEDQLVILNIKNKNLQLFQLGPVHSYLIEQEKDNNSCKSQKKKFQTLQQVQQTLIQNRKNINFKDKFKSDISTFHIVGNKVYLRTIDNVIYETPEFSNWDNQKIQEVKSQYQDIFSNQFHDILFNKDNTSQIYDLRTMTTKNIDVPNFNFNGIVRVDDQAHNSIRSCQIATYYSNHDEHYVKTLIITRSIEQNQGQFEYKFKEAQNYKINLQMPTQFKMQNGEEQEDIQISLAACLDGHFFLVISHEDILSNQAIFQKYRISQEQKEQNHLIFVQEIKISYNKFYLPKQIPSLPYFAVSWESFLNLKDMKEVSLQDDLPEEQQFLVEPYSQNFVLKLLDECKAQSLLDLPQIQSDRFGQITLHGMIVYFLIKAGYPSACVLILQPQKGKITVLKFQPKIEQKEFVKTYIVNDPEKSQLHVFTRNSKKQIIHLLFNIKDSRIKDPQNQVVCKDEYDIGGVFLSKNASTLSVIFTGVPKKNDEGTTQTESFYALQQYQTDGNNILETKENKWKHKFNIDDIKKNKSKNKAQLIDKIAKIFLEIAKDYPIEIDQTLDLKLREIILGQLKDEYSLNDTFHMIAYKSKKLVVYNISESKEVFFLNDNFQINSIIEFKQGIKKVIKINADQPDTLLYIDKLSDCHPHCQIPDKVLFHENMISEYQNGSEMIYFFESPIGRISYQVLTTLQLRTLETKIDQKASQKDKQTDRLTTQEIIKEIEENSIGYVFSYNIKKEQNIFLATQDYDDVRYIYDAIQRKLELCGDDELPMPLLIHNLDLSDTKKYSSIIDILIEKKAFSLILSICTTALTQDITGLMYEELALYLEKLNFSKSFVRRYLASEICFGKISSNKYEEFQEDKRQIIHPCSEYDTFAEIIEDFDKIEGEMLGKISSKVIEAGSETAIKYKNDSRPKTFDANDGDPDKQFGLMNQEKTDSAFLGCQQNNLLTAGRGGEIQDDKMEDEKQEIIKMNQVGDSNLKALSFSASNKNFQSNQNRIQLNSTLRDKVQAMTDLSPGAQQLQQPHSNQVTPLVQAEGDQAKNKSREDKVAWCCRKRQRIESHNQYPIEYFTINLSKMRSTDVDVNDGNVKSDPNGSQLSQNEYSISEKRGVTELIVHLANNDQEILEIETIKAIIEFKWETYTKYFFSIQLFLILIVVVAFIVDVAAIADNPRQIQTEDLTQIVARIICITILSILNLYEFFTFLINPTDYQKDYWNMNDQLLFLLYLSYFVLSFADPTQLQAIKALQMAITISGFFKLSLLIRIFTELSFLVKMLTTVFQNLGLFFIYFLMVIGAFTVMIDIVSQDVGDAYQGISKAALFVMALRQSIGDGDTSTLIDSTHQNYKILVWILWFMILIVGNVVFMNFIIAVVNEGYSECAQKKEQCIQMAKLEMIQECENLLPDYFIKKQKWFPRFIIIRRLRKDDDQINIDQQQLMVKQIRYHLQEEMNVVNKQFIGTQMQFKSSINFSKQDLSVKINERMDKLESLMGELKNLINENKSPTE